MCLPSLFDYVFGSPLRMGNALRSSRPKLPIIAHKKWNPINSFAKNYSSTVEGRASSCHIVGRASDTILLRVLVPVPLATCTLFTGYLIEYALLMRFLAHH